MTLQRAILTTATIICGISVCVSSLDAYSSYSPIEAQSTPGDLNSNGVYDFDDVAILRSVLLGAPMTLPKAMYDVNLDERVDRTDVEMLTSWAERSEGSELPEEELSGSPLAASRSVLRGDVDGDGDLDADDAVHLQDVVMGVARPRNGFESADVNADGRITIDDLFLLAEILWGKGEPKP